MDSRRFRPLRSVLAVMLSVVLSLSTSPIYAAYALENEDEASDEATVLTLDADASGEDAEEADGSEAEEAVEETSSGTEESDEAVVDDSDEAATDASADGVDDVVEEEEAASELSLEALSTSITSDSTSGEAVSLSWSAHVQTYGDSSGTTADATETTTIGTTGKSKRLEAVSLELDSELSGSITYRVHCQTYGWTDWVSDGELAGTTGESKRLEAIQIELTGELADEYDVYYRVHSQTYGWLDWACNGEEAGTSGLSRRVEAIQIVLVEKGGEAPGDTDIAYVEAPSLSYSYHVQTYGTSSGSTSNIVTTKTTLGTTGKSKRLEAVSLELDSELSGSITYRVHCQTYGWTDWVSDGELAGTTGESKRLEAIQIELTGELADYFDVYYRVHSQTYGWLDWACNGEEAGTFGLSRRGEAIQIVLVPKGTSAPGDTDVPYVDSPTLSVQVHMQSYGWLDSVGSGETAGKTGSGKRVEALKISMDSEVSGSITYSAYVEDSGWQDWVSDGSTAGTTGSSKRMEAVKIKLTGDAADYYDVWYRVYVKDYGWLGWAKNGAKAGTTGLDYRIEAIQVKIQIKGTSAPGSTSTAYTTISSARASMLSKAQNYSSNTSYLILVNSSTNRVGIYKGSKGNWTEVYYWICTTGASSTPTVKGTFTTKSKGYSFGSSSYTCYYYTQFYGNYLFHSVLYYPGTFTIKDGTLGANASHGCVRLALDNAKWIYNNIPTGTKVVSY